MRGLSATWFISLHLGIGHAIECDLDQYKCRNENADILAINEWNREAANCIPMRKRCDGRHDCQDGSDEFECKFLEQEQGRHFLCFEGFNNNLRSTDCIDKDRRNGNGEKKWSVSESPEWVCAKFKFTNGTVLRACEKTYTGGEKFSVCFWSSKSGTKCICSSQLCNSSRSLQFFEFFSFIYILIIYILNS
ncbi:vitellogenin receptor [Eurytemora carolleeae]|uniref:vitellogenin receptor n=1 Tax=Eurytemora carolleeae TaxID=1294199 RepID=UPI000C7634A5|nr:vitellogenin receptor [Eurytemora carolleeae]|eukprot:XP_023324362.1 vitellogenin receptor-like [Eurytemora affinis]